jgi:hypothetical protein
MTETAPPTTNRVSITRPSTSTLRLVTRLAMVRIAGIALLIRLAGRAGRPNALSMT